MELLKSYPFTVRVHQKMGGSFRIITDKGRIVRLKTQVELLRLKNLKRDVEFPEYRYIYQTAKGKKVIDFYSTTEGEFYPMEIHENVDRKTGKLIMTKKPVEKDVQLWYINNYHRIQEKYRKEEGMLSKLLPYIGLGLTVGLIAFVAIFTYNGLVDISNAAGAAAGSIKDATANLDRYAATMERIIGDKDVIQTVVQVPATPDIG